MAPAWWSRPWRGYAGQKNFAAVQASHDWVLSIDADEALSEALEAEIWRIKKNGPRFDAYTMPRMARYLGRWILHSGWYPDRKVRLYDRRKAKWVGEYVHESVQVKGTSVTCNATCCTTPTIRFPSTCASWTATRRWLPRRLVARKRQVYWTDLVLDPFWTFVRTYFLQAGFLDGMEGLTIAFMAAFYNFLKYAKARNMS